MAKGALPAAKLEVQANSSDAVVADVAGYAVLDDPSGDSVFSSKDQIVYSDPIDGLIPTEPRLKYSQQAMVRLTYWTGSVWVCVDRYATTQNAAETYVTTTGQYVNALIDIYDNVRFAGSNASLWISRMDNVYLSLQDLVGATPYSGSKIQIRTDRSLPTGIWAYSGNPIRINQLHMGQFIEQINNDGNWGFGVLHELGHDFDSGKNWNFDAEFFANFKAAYAIMQRGAKVYVGNSYYTGSQIMNYYYNGASSCYLTSYNVGSYHHDFLTYIFLRIIQNNFGGDWTAIKKRFAILA